MLLRRADAQTNILLICRELALRASWEILGQDGTILRHGGVTRPTWDRLMQRTGLSRATIAAHLRWLRDVGLLALVSGGTTATYSPAVLAGPNSGQETNSAAVYVLIAPHALRLVAQAHPEDVGAAYLHDGRDLPAEPYGPATSPAEHQEDRSTPRRPGPVDTSRTPTGLVLDLSPPARARHDDQPGAGLRPALPEPLPQRRANHQDPPGQTPWPLTTTPAGKQERKAAAAALQAALPVLYGISAAHVASLCRELWLAGWTPADIVTAIGRRPDGTPWHHGNPITHTPGWLRNRLAPWRADPSDPTSPPGRSPRTRAAAAAAHTRAINHARRARATAEAAQVACADPTAVRAAADTVRAALRVARERDQEQGDRNR